VDSFTARGGDFVLVCLGDRAFADLVSVLERPDLLSDPRFATNADRNANEGALRTIIANWSAQQDRESALDKLREHNVPCAPVWSLGELIESGQVEARGLLKCHPGTATDVLPFVAQPVRFSNARSVEGRAAPALGQHTEEVLRERLGLGPEEIARLRAAGAI
jgi:CoA:oxalate CoA-transferase